MFGSRLPPVGHEMSLKESPEGDMKSLLTYIMDPNMNSQTSKEKLAADL